MAQRKKKSRFKAGGCNAISGAKVRSVCLYTAGVAAEPKHDYGHTMMALAETLASLGEAETAIQTWQRVTAEYSYARARVQLAELLFRQRRNDEARAILTEVLTDDPHNPVFQRRKDRPWIKRAKALIGQV